MAEVLARVREEGDDALAEFTRRFDRFDLRRRGVAVSRREIDAAWKRTPKAIRASLALAASRIEAFHRHQAESGFTAKIPGAILGQRVLAVARAGVYVPGGKAAYPSTLLMNTIPAKVAGVKEVYAACSAPGGTSGRGPGGRDESRGSRGSSASAARQAIAAFAYGTRSIPRVDVIAGPGNAYVTEAKRQVYGLVGLDMLAGPSELVVLADESARARFVAADLLSQAEHDEDAFVALVTDSARLAAKVTAELAKQGKKLPRQGILAGSLSRAAGFLVRGIDEGIEVVNRLAPEHLSLMLDEPWAALERIRNAGTAYVGHDSPVAMGDYLAGVNHTLPTGGAARLRLPPGRCHLPQADERGIIPIPGTRGRFPSRRASCRKGRVVRPCPGRPDTDRKGGTIREMPREAQVVRKTKETDVRLTLRLEGEGEGRISTSVPFFDHMLTLFSRHGFFNLTVAAKGDTDVDFHHVVEDVGICLGEAFRKSLGNLGGIARYAHASIPMIEALAQVTVDVSARPHLVFHCPLKHEKVGGFDLELVGGVPPRILAVFRRVRPRQRPVRVQRAPHRGGDLQGAREGDGGGGADRPAGEGGPLVQRRSRMTDNGLIGVVDYGMGNLRSVSKALESLGFPTVVSGSPAALSRCAGIVLPGVGAFRDCMKNLRRQGLLPLLADALGENRPFLGICPRAADPLHRERGVRPAPRGSGSSREKSSGSRPACGRGSPRAGRCARSRCRTWDGTASTSPWTTRSFAGSRPARTSTSSTPTTWSRRTRPSSPAGRRTESPSPRPWGRGT